MVEGRPIQPVNLGNVFYVHLMVEGRPIQPVNMGNVFYIHPEID